MRIEKTEGDSNLIVKESDDCTILNRSDNGLMQPVNITHEEKIKLERIEFNYSFLSIGK